VTWRKEVNGSFSGGTRRSLQRHGSETKRLTCRIDIVALVPELARQHPGKCPLWSFLSRQHSIDAIANGAVAAVSGARGRRLTHVHPPTRAGVPIHSRTVSSRSAAIERENAINFPYGLHRLLSRRPSRQPLSSLLTLRQRRLFPHPLIDGNANSNAQD
jgi:hypothetical protein